MFGPQVVATLLVVILLLAYQPYFHPLFSYFSSRSAANHPQKITAMKTLIASPGFGHFFYEELIEELVM